MKIYVKVTEEKKRDLHHSIANIQIYFGDCSEFSSSRQHTAAYKSSEQAHKNTVREMLANYIQLCKADYPKNAILIKLYIKLEINRLDNVANRLAGEEKEKNPTSSLCYIGT